MWDYFVLSPRDDSFFIFKCISFNTWKYLCLKEKSAVLIKSVNNSLICEHGANHSWEQNESAPMHLTCVQQSCHSFPLAFCGVTVLWGIMRKAFSTIIPFSCLQAWPQGGQSSPPGAGRASSLWSPLVTWWAPAAPGQQGFGCFPRGSTVSYRCFGGHSF